MKPFRKLVSAVVVACGVALAAGPAIGAPDTVIGFDDQPANPNIVIADQYVGAGVEFGHPHRWGIDFGVNAGCGGTGAALGAAAVADGGITGRSLYSQCTGLGVVDQLEDKGYSLGWRFATERRMVTFKVRAAPNSNFAGSQPGPFAASVRFYSAELTLLSQQNLSLGNGAVTTVTLNRSPTQEIAYVIITAPQGGLFLDDIVATLDDVPPPAKFSIALDRATLGLVEGDTGVASLKAVRFNGSTGSVALNVGSLPTGIISAIADPLGGTASVDLRVTAASPATGDRQVTVTSANGAAGTFVGSPLTLTVQFQTALTLDRTTFGVTPGCGTSLQNINAVVRGNYAGLVTLSLIKLGGPSSLNAFLTAHASGNGTISFPVAVDSPPTESPSTYEVKLSPAGATPVTAGLAVFAGAANSVRISGLDNTVIFNSPGNGDARHQAIIRGNFPSSCPLTFRDDAGNVLPVVPGSVSRAPEQDEGRRLDLGTDPVSTSVHAFTAAGTEIATSARIRVGDYRNTFGLSQANSGAGARIAGIAWDDFLRAFGKDDAESCFDFYCWRDWTAIAYYNQYATLLSRLPAAGLCYGWAAQSIAFFTGDELLSSFAAGAASPFAIRDWSDTSAAKHNIATWHMRQFNRDHQLEIRRQAASPGTPAQLRQKIEEALARKQPPIIAIWRNAYGTPGNAGHAVVAYDTRTTATGFDILTYNPNTPYVTGEETVTATRTANLAANLIQVTSGGVWSGGITGWSGGMGQIMVLPLPPLNSALPKDLPTVSAGSAESQILQIAVDGKDALRADGSVLPGRGVEDASLLTGVLEVPVYRLSTSKPATLEIAGKKSGNYSAALLGGAVTATVSDARTSQGQRDTLTVDPDKARLLFASDAGAAPVTLRLGARQGSGATRGALVSLTAGAGRQDALSLAGSLVLDHSGGGTRATVTLVQTAKGLPESVTYAPIAVGADNDLSLRPDSWANLTAGATFTVKDRAGRVVRSGRASVRPPATIRLASRLSLQTKRLKAGRGVVTVKGRVPRRGTAPQLLVKVTVVRGGKTVLTATATRRGLAQVRAGGFSIPVNVRNLPAGARVEATVTLIDEGASLASLSARGSARVR